MKTHAALLLASLMTLTAKEPAQVVELWPGTPPGDQGLELPPEVDKTKPEDKLIAGRRIIKLGNVSRPSIAFYPAPKELATGTTVIVCPGGGHHILAYDLEGTEVAEWLNGLGVHSLVLKYRVPFRNPDKRYEAAVQDAQRALGIARSRAKEWGLAADRIGILGFSAGGETAGLAALFGKDRTYDSVDEADSISCRPDFAVLIYPGGFYDRKSGSLKEGIPVPSDAPPFFLVQAGDDHVPVENSVLLYLALKNAGVPAELHVHDRGGHGYGLRPVPELPVTLWPRRVADWMHTSGFLPNRH